MNKIFYENVRLSYPEFILLQYDGTLRMRHKRKIKPRETLVNQFIIPLGKKRRLQLLKRVIWMIRKGEAYLERDFIITPNLQFIKSNQRIIQAQEIRNKARSHMMTIISSNLISNI